MCPGCRDAEIRPDSRLDVDNHDQALVWKLKEQFHRCWCYACHLRALTVPHIMSLFLMSSLIIWNLNTALILQTTTMTSSISPSHFDLTVIQSHRNEPAESSKSLDPDQACCLLNSRIFKVNWFSSRTLPLVQSAFACFNVIHITDSRRRGLCHLNLNTFFSYVLSRLYHASL